MVQAEVEALKLALPGLRQLSISGVIAASRSQHMLYCMQAKLVQAMSSALGGWCSMSRSIWPQIT